MARQRTSFDELFDQEMKDPEFAAGYVEARAEIDQVDDFMRSLEAARAAKGVSKAELARQSGMPAAAVRRLLTAPDEANPTIATILGILRPMGLGLRIVATAKGHGRKGRPAHMPALRNGKTVRVRVVRKGTVRAKPKGRAGQAPALPRR
jgi:DNA-binding phage protein